MVGTQIAPSPSFTSRSCHVGSGARTVLRVEDGRAERDEGVGHIVVGRLRGARVVAAREGDEPEIDVGLDACDAGAADTTEPTIVTAPLPPQIVS